MKKIKVASGQGSYEVIVGKGLLSKASKLIRESFAKAKKPMPGKALIVTQKPIAKHYLKTLQNSLSKNFEVFVHYVPNGEKAKCQAELFKIYKVLLAKGFERRDLIVALGGGVVGDLSGFTAATYLRGISFVNIATTLLAQVDSAIGGKTGINLDEGKNLVGSFYPPRLVLSDIDTLKTLPAREYKASLAEVVKYGVIYDAKLFSLLEKSISKIKKRDTNVLVQIVTRCSQIKGLVVTRDEKESTGLRMILNYGHTFGHGFEQAKKYSGFLHGEAVAVGMVCAGYASEELGLLSTKMVERQNQLIQALGLPLDVQKMKVNVQAVIAAMQHDKKKDAGRLRFILADCIGHVRSVDKLTSTTLSKLLLRVGCTPKRKSRHAKSKSTKAKR